MATPSISQDSSELIAAVEEMLAEVEVETVQEAVSTCPLSEEVQIELWQLFWKLNKRFGHVHELLQMSALLNLSDDSFERARGVLDGKAA